MSQNQCGIATAYGNIWMNTNNWTGKTYSLTTSYTEMTSLGTNFTLMTPNVDFAMSTDGRLKYTGTDTLNFIANACINGDTHSASKAVAIYKNGSLITGAENYGTSISNDYSFPVVDVPVSLATNDYLSVWLKGSISSAALVIYQVSLSAKSIL